MTELADKDYMQQVLQLANKAFYSSAPNPRMACIIVNQGEIVAQAYHQSAGEFHAERQALSLAGEKARGATVYVNIEPCCHQGRTPPCTDALIDAGVSRVVAAMRDPNPLVDGGGFELLKGAGIDVEVGVLQQQAIWLNRGFVKRMTAKKPWLSLKSSLQNEAGNIIANGWLGGDEVEQFGQSLRAASSAVMTGINHILNADPSLNVSFAEQSNSEQLNPEQRQPLRVVLDSQLEIPLHARIIDDQQALIVFTLSDDLSKIAALSELGVEVIQQTADQTELDLEQVMQGLAKWQCNEVLVEAAPELSQRLLKLGLVDEVALFCEPAQVQQYAVSLAVDSLLPINGSAQFQIRQHFMQDNQLAPDENVDNFINIVAINQYSEKSLFAL